MKKAERIIAALLSAAVTAGMAAGTNAFANIDVRSSDEISKLLDGYTEIEDPAAFEMQEYSIGQGSSYYVSDSGSMRVIRTMPNSFTIEVPQDMPDKELEEIVNGICQGAELHKGNASLEKPDTKVFEAIAGADSDITLEQAKKVCEEAGDNVVNFRYYCGRYQMNQPQYLLSQHKYFKELYGSAVNGKSDYTLYEGIENQEKLQAFINENGLNCHTELHEKINAVDVVPDTDISYPEEVQLAGRIYSGTGLKPGFWCMAESVSDRGSEIDMHNSVEGDSNCDGQLDMADAVLIMQALANPNKYSVSAQGRFNSDTNGDGITVGDAQTIQKILLGIL